MAGNRRLIRPAAWVGLVLPSSGASALRLRSSDAGGVAIANVDLIPRNAGGLPPPVVR